jgi:hypothetical protein
MECCGIIHDYVLKMCICVPCETLHVSLGYLDVLKEAGII